MTTAERIARLRSWLEEPEPPEATHGNPAIDAGLGAYKCGCYFDSGVFLNECQKHSGPSQADVRALLEALAEKS